MNVYLVLGARPQIIKSTPIVFESVKHQDFNLKIIHTGQHYDYEMSRMFFEEMHLPDPIQNLRIGSGSHAKQTGQMLMKLEDAFLRYHPDFVIVPGDTNSTLAGALAAAKLKIPLAHMEAGARSYDMSMPEEVNRRLTDHCSDVLLTVSENCSANLIKEGISRDKMFCVGDTMYDVLLSQMSRIEKSPILEELDLNENEFVIVTSHRQENVDNERNLREIIETLQELEGIPIVFPVHPRMKKKLEETGLMKGLGDSKRIQLLPPLGYHEALKLVKHSMLLITDSGGMQKESFWLKTPCITIRTTTEWTETIESGANILAGPSKSAILFNVNRIMNEGIDSKAFDRNPYGDGHAAEKIIKTLSSF